MRRVDGVGGSLDDPALAAEIAAHEAAGTLQTVVLDSAPASAAERRR